MRRSDHAPDFSRADVGCAVITVRHVGDEASQRAKAAGAVEGRRTAPWPDGLLSWTLLTSTDGQALLAYEQWADGQSLDAAASRPAPHPHGIPGTESGTPVRYRLFRSHVSMAEGEVGCVVTPVFDVDGPERQRHFVDEIFRMTSDMPPTEGAIAAHFHFSLDGTRVFNYAEWVDEQSHVDAVTGEDPRGFRRRVSGEIPGVRPCGYRRWHPHTSLTAGDLR